MVARAGERESGSGRKPEKRCTMYINLEGKTFTWVCEEGVGPEHTSISNGIAFRWKIHFKLKINVFQKHILSFGIDNINSSCVRSSRARAPCQRLMKFTLFLCASNSRTQICHRTVTTRSGTEWKTRNIIFCMKNPSMKIHDKSLVAFSLSHFRSIFYLHLACSAGFRSLCGAAPSLSHTRLCMCYACMPQMKWMN